MTQLMPPRTLVENSQRINAQKRLRIVKYLNEALQALVLAPEQTRVERLSLPQARLEDADMIKHLMEEAGYRTVSVVSRNAGLNETDIVVSFSFLE